MTKSGSGRKGFIPLTLPQHRAGPEGRGVEGGAEVEGMWGAAHWPVPHGLLSYTFQSHQQGRHHLQ